MMRHDQFEATVAAYFERVHREVFLGDTAVNANLFVETSHVGEHPDRTSLILVTPWTINGMFTLDGDEDAPPEVIVGAKPHPVFVNEIPEIGRYGSINLISNTAGIESMDAARSTVKGLAKAFRKGLDSAFDAAQVPDPGRRNLLRGEIPTN